jgi:hypothetical protein
MSFHAAAVTWIVQTLVGSDAPAHLNQDLAFHAMQKARNPGPGGRQTINIWPLQR